MNCNDVRDRLVDFLYGELGAEDRRTFDAHVAVCEACRGEVAAFQRTLGRTRTALASGLAEEPPPRVRAAVLRAAAQAHAAPLPAEGFWAWARRPWVLPAFAAASLMVVFVIGRKAIVNPERVMMRADQARPASAPVAAEEPAPAAPAANDREQAAEKPSLLARNHTETSGTEAHRMRAKAPSRRARLSEGKRQFAESPPPRTGLLDGLEAKEVAQAALGRGESAGAQMKAEAPATKFAAGGEGAPAPKPAPAGKRDFVRRSEPAAVAAPAESDALADEAPVRKGDDDVSPVEALERRAERAFNAARWADAAAAYRELLRRFPEHAKTKIWKERLVAALQALGR